MQHDNTQRHKNNNEQQDNNRLDKNESYNPERNTLNEKAEPAATNNNTDVTDSANISNDSQEQPERLYQQRAALYHAKAVANRKIEIAFREFEEILRIIHSTNWRNQVQVKKNIYEIELICKNAILEIKGV